MLGQLDFQRGRHTFAHCNETMKAVMEVDDLHLLVHDDIDGLPQGLKKADTPIIAATFWQ